MPVLRYPVASDGAGQGALDHLGDLIKTQGSSLPCHQPWILIPKTVAAGCLGLGLFSFAAKAVDPVVDHTTLEKTAADNRTSHLC